MAGVKVAGGIAALVVSGLLAGTAFAGCITCHSNADVLKKLVQPPQAAHSEGEG